jgi:hypothetical protein
MFVRLPASQLAESFFIKLSDAIVSVSQPYPQLVHLVFAVLLIGSFLYFVRHAEQQTSLCVVLLMLIPLLFCVGRDIRGIVNEHRTCSLALVEGNFLLLVSRYLIPTILGLQIGLAFVLSRLMTTKNSAGCVFLIVMSITTGLQARSCIESQNRSSEDVEAVAQLINAEPEAVLVTNWSATPICRYLKKDVKLIAMVGNESKPLEQLEKFFVVSKPKLIKKLRASKQYDCRLSKVSRHLWKVSRKPVSN